MNFSFSRVGIPFLGVVLLMNLTSPNLKAEAYTAPQTVEVSYSKTFTSFLNEVNQHIKTAVKSGSTTDFEVAIDAFLNMNDFLTEDVVAKHQDYDQPDQVMINLFNALDDLPKASSRPLFNTWIDGLIKGELAHEDGYFDTFIYFVETESRDEEVVAYAKHARKVYEYIQRQSNGFTYDFDEIWAIDFEIKANPAKRKDTGTTSTSGKTANQEWAAQFAPVYADDDLSFEPTSETVTNTEMTTYEYAYEADEYGVCYELVTEFTNGEQTKTGKQKASSDKAHYCGDMTQFDWGSAKEVNENGQVNGGNKVLDTNDYLYYFIGDIRKKLSFSVTESQQLSYPDFLKVMAVLTTDLNGTSLVAEEGALYLLNGQLYELDAYEAGRPLMELSQVLSSKVNIQLGTQTTGAIS